MESGQGVWTTVVRKFMPFLCPETRRVSTTTRQVVTVVVLTAAVSACAPRQGSAPDVSSGNEAGAQLREAATATLRMRSFRATITTTGGPGLEETTTVVDYEAPDRMRLVQTAMSPSLPPIEPLVQIAISTTSYFSVPGRPGFFFRLTVPTDATVGLVLTPLRALLQASDVEQDGPVFTFSIPAFQELPSGPGEARISQGRIVSLTMQPEFDGLEIRYEYTFSMFDSAPPVTPPAKDRIVPYEPAGFPPCPPEGASPPAVVTCGPSPG
jgi:hypothetical protein